MSESNTAVQPLASVPSIAAPLAILLAVAEVLVDWNTWVGLNVAILYSLPLVVAAVARDRKVMWSLAGVLVCATFGVYVAQVDQGEAAMRGSFFIDRVLAAACIFLNAGILDAWMRSVDRLVLRDRAIERHNARLAAMNRELTLNKEQITRQNEELERRRLELEQVSMRKTQMLASLSHDIRTPIQAITLLSELMRRTAERPELADRIPALAQRLQSNAVSVVDFLSEVIDVASFDAGRVSVNSSEFSVNALIDEQCQRLLSLAEEKGLQLLVDASTQPLWLLTDRVKLGRIIANLVSNAIKFTQSGAVTVACGLQPDGAVSIRVEDTGCGMRREHLEQVFGEYSQLNQQPAQTGSGWGLGLAISRRMVRLLGGEISVSSQLHSGSTFTVVLPASCVTHERGGAS
jgi:signal transduction histidine kinase